MSNFLSKAEKCFIICIDYTLCIHSSVWILGYCEYDIFKQVHKIHSLSYLTLINPEFKLYQTFCYYKQCFLL